MSEPVDPPSPPPLPEKPPVAPPIAPPMVLGYLTPKTQNQRRQALRPQLTDLVGGLMTVLATVLMNLLYLAAWRYQMRLTEEPAQSIATAGAAEAIASIAWSFVLGVSVVLQFFHSDLSWVMLRLYGQVKLVLCGLALVLSVLAMTFLRRNGIPLALFIGVPTLVGTMLAWSYWRTAKMMSQRGF